MAWTHTRAEIARTKKKDPQADVTELLRQLKAERLAIHISKLVDSAPPLTVEQRAKLALLLRGGGTDGA